MCKHDQLYVSQVHQASHGPLTCPLREGLANEAVELAAVYGVRWRKGVHRSQGAYHQQGLSVDGRAKWAVILCDSERNGL